MVIWTLWEALLKHAEDVEGCAKVAVLLIVSSCNPYFGDSTPRYTEAARFALKASSLGA
jgi:hypothetical protein